MCVYMCTYMYVFSRNQGVHQTLPELVLLITVAAA